MTPFELDILFHYYVSPIEHRVVIDNPPIWARTRQWFLDENLLQVRKQHSIHGATYEVTGRAMCLINHIMALPLPVNDWRMPEAPKGEK